MGLHESPSGASTGMSLHVHRAADAQVLVGGLVDLIDDGGMGADPFAPEVIAVPSRGIERWISQELAQRLGAAPGKVDGIAANLAFPGTVIHTLGPNPKPNVVHDIKSEGLLVSTEKSDAAGQPPQDVPAWMIQAASDQLRTHGELTNRHLLHDIGVRRSSFVCALLARLPDVTVKPDLTRHSGDESTRPTQDVVMSWTDIQTIRHMSTNSRWVDRPHHNVSR